MPVHTIALELTFLLTFWLWLGVWQRERGTRGRNTFAALAACAVVWCLGDVLQQQQGFPEIVADRIRYLGILALPPLWLGLAAHAARLDLARRVPWFPLVLLAPLLAPYGLMYTDSWSALFVRTVADANDQYGPVFWLSVFYSYALMAVGCGLFMMGAWRTRQPGEWLRPLFIGLAPLIPLAGNAVFIARGMVDPIDPTPALFGVALIALRSSLYRGSLFQALPVSQHDLIEQLPIGVILVDRGGVVIDMNPAAEQRLQVSEREAIGRNCDAVLGGAEGDVPSEFSPIFAHGREVGQLVLIDPPRKDD